MSWYVIVVAVLVVAGIAYILWRLFRGPLFRNRGQGWLMDIPVGEDSAAARCILPPAVQVFKRVCNLTRTAHEARAWATQVLAGVTDVLQFRLEIQNTGYMPVPADEIRVADQPYGAANGDPIDGSGVANINGGPDIVLDDALMGQFFGQGILMSDIPGAAAELGPRQSLFVRYRVRIAPPAGGGGGAPGGGGPPPGP